MDEILKFLSSNKDALTFLFGSGFLVAIAKWVGAYLKYRRTILISTNTFPFEVFKPGSDKVLQHLMDAVQGDENDALADFNIPYQSRQLDRNVRRELEKLLDEKRWVLVVGRTGLGKTREAAELAQIYNREGWTVIKLTDQEWLDVPRQFSKDKIGNTHKLLFFLDDLNYWMYRGQRELSPNAEQPFQPLNVPLQERLLRVLEFYEIECRSENIRVLATARDEKEREIAYKISEWEKLEFEKYPRLWKRFHIYTLAEPEDQAIVDLLNEVVPKAGIQAHSEDYLKIAQRNDRTFRNIVENLQTARSRNWSLAPDKFPETLDKTWSKRYRRAVEEYPVARYIYDAIDLLRSLNIALYDFTVAPTARMLAGGNWLQKLGYRWQIYIALRHLIRAERILEPRDGQIEAKGQPIELGEYIPQIIRLLLNLANHHPQELLSSLLGFSITALTRERNQEALRTINQLLKQVTDFDGAWVLRGNALSKLGRSEEAIASYEQALQLKPDLHEAWYNQGNTLDNLGRYEEAIASFDKALQLKPDYHEAWYNRGIALDNLGRSEEAIASFDKALQLKPDYHEAWNNRGIALGNLGRYEEAIASYEQALQLKPDDPGSWYNKACCYGLQGNVELAVDSLQQAIQLSPDQFREDGKGRY